MLSIDERLPSSFLGWRELSTYGRPLPLFFVLEAGLLLALAVKALPGTDRTSRLLAAVAALSLALIPFVHIGKYNDFVMRASIPALFTTWVLVGRALTREDGGSRWARRALVAALAIGSVTAATEFARSIKRYRFAIPPRAQVDEVQNLRPRAVALQYLGRNDSYFFVHLARRADQLQPDLKRPPQAPASPERRPRGGRRKRQRPDGNAAAAPPGKSRATDAVRGAENGERFGS